MVMSKAIENAMAQHRPQANTPLYDDSVEITFQKPKTEWGRYGIPRRYEKTSYKTLEGTEGVKHCIEYSKNAKRSVSSGNGVILVGGVGTGKTSAGIAILKQYIEEGGNGFFITAADLIDSFYTLSTEERQDLERRVRTVPLLMIDDFGAESNKDWVATKIESIISDRYNNMKANIITTNLTVKDMKTGYSQRLLDRLKASAEIITFQGESRRKAIGD